MSDNDVQYKDTNSPALTFNPESIDMGSNVRRSMFGAKDGAIVSIGSVKDTTASLSTGALTGQFSLIALMRAIAGWALAPFVATIDARATGTINLATANATYPVTLQGGQGVIGFNVSGLSGSGAVLTVETANNSGTFTPANALIPGAIGQQATLSQTITTDGNFRVNAGGHSAVQLRVSSAGTGTANVTSTAMAGGGGIVAMSQPLPAGENHAGEFGGNVGRAQAQFGPASSTTYTAGMIMSAPIRLDGMSRKSNGTGIITSAVLALNVANVSQIDLVVFGTAPSGTYTAGSTWTNTTADRPKILAVLKVSDWTALSTTDSVGEVVGGAKFFTCDDVTNSSSFWIVPVARGTIALASATDATLTLRTSRN